MPWLAIILGYIGATFVFYLLYRWDERTIKGK
jgi:L-asparagine transporter-like permease